MYVNKYDSNENTRLGPGLVWFTELLDIRHCTLQNYEGKMHRRAPYKLPLLCICRALIQQLAFNGFLPS